MVDVQQGLSSAGGILKELHFTEFGGHDEEVSFDYDMELSSGIRRQPPGESLNLARRRLLRAACGDDAPTVLQLVAEGADLYLVGEALRLAAYRGSACVVRELVAVGLSVNDPCPYTGMTSLQLAAGSGHILVCELLLDAMADVQKSACRGQTAIELARRKGHVEVQEVIERHISALLIAGKGEEQDEGGAYRRAHVLPRVSPVLSEAVLQVGPSLLPTSMDSELREFKPPTGWMVDAFAFNNVPDEPDPADRAGGAPGYVEPDVPADDCDHQQDAPAHQASWRELPPQQVMPL